MSIIFDILILLVIVFFCHRGAKRGMAATLISIVVFIIAMTGAGFASKEYSGELTTSMNPFVSGLMESQGAPAAQKNMGLRESGVSANDMIEEEPTLIYDYSNACFEALGVSSITADKFSGVTAQEYVNGNDVTEAINTSFCKAAAYFIGVIIAFTVIIIFLSVLVELAIKPKHKLSEEKDEYFGTIAGFFKGVVVCIALCWVFSFLGVIIGRSTIENSYIGKFLLALNYLTDLAVA